ncbi:MAG: hypothetical protein ACLQOO_04815 [Terriglobia bacterium]
MARLNFIEIDGKRYLWRDVLQLCREQKKAHAQAQQPALFELREDRRPAAERTAAGRYLNRPSSRGERPLPARRRLAPSSS